MTNPKTTLHTILLIATSSTRPILTAEGRRPCTPPNQHYLQTRDKNAIILSLYKYSGHKKCNVATPINVTDALKVTLMTTRKATVWWGVRNATLFDITRQRSPTWISFYVFEVKEQVSQFTCLTQLRVEMHGQHLLANK